VGDSREEDRVGRPRRRREDNIKITRNIQYVLRGVMDWFASAQGRGSLRALVNAAMSLWVPYNAGNFLTSLGPVSFPASSSSVCGAGGNPAYRTSAFEAVCTLTPVFSSPVHLQRRFMPDRLRDLY
jgi:hypothetical protein